MLRTNATVLRKIGPRQWGHLPKNSPVWVCPKKTGGRLLRFIIERNNLTGSPAELILRLPFELGTVACPAAEIEALLCLARPPYRRKDAYFIATRKGGVAVCAL